MATGYNVRVGDADREAVAAQLREHYADGRLTIEELNERIDQTFAAKTKADLNTVMRDLPQATRPTAGAPYGGTAWQGPAWQGPLATRPGQDNGHDWDNGQRPRGPGAFAPMIGLVWLFVILGSVILFGGFGGGRPLAIVLFLAALALVRRLIGLGRRRGGSGPRGPRGPRGRRRW
jgi:Domain of unknown function (DUF1707)